MKDFFKSLADYVFSFGMFMFLFIGVAIFLMFKIADADQANRAKYAEATRAATEICYSQGLVLVDTDAGQRCADPRTLVKVK